jgi:hypothetical protein
MIRVVQVLEAFDYFLVLSTYFATQSPRSQEQQYYLSVDIEWLLEETLLKLASGDRETMRVMGCALYHEFRREFPTGVLHAICSYRLDRLIQFEQAQRQLTRIHICQLSTKKEIVSLGVSAADLSSETGQIQLPRLPFSCQVRRYQPRQF